MSLLALFELDEVVPALDWAPVYEVGLAAMGWTATENGVVLDSDGAGVSKPEWNAFIASGRCRDCGKSGATNQGGVEAGVAYRVCDPCAQLDDARLVDHPNTDLDRPLWLSRWGMWHLPEAHDQLIADQARRRANYPQGAKTRRAAA